MKKYFLPVLLIVLCLVSVTAIPFTGCASDDSPIRIHIRANSDSDQDQAVKYVVRDQIVNYLTPLLSGARSRNEAFRLVRSHTDEAEDLAAYVLSSCGFDYGATAYVSREHFPDRSYGDVFYPAGMYDAIIIELGSGSGAKTAKEWAEDTLSRLSSSLTNDNAGESTTFKLTLTAE